MIIIPFSDTLGPKSGPSRDGCLHSVLPVVAPSSAISSALGSSGSKVYHGDADSSGNISYHNITTAANNETSDDVMLFDSTNPSKDVLCVEMVTGDKIESIDLYQTRAAVITGTLTAKVWYKSITGSWVDVIPISTPLLTTTGLKRVPFASIDVAQIALTDDLIDPRNNVQMRCLFLSFDGVTGVTTSPLFSRVFKRRTSDAPKIITNFTNLLNQGSSPDFTAWTALNIMPLNGDVSLIGFNAPLSKLQARIVRARYAAWATDLIYSRANGTFEQWPSANVTLGSASTGNELWTSAILNTWLEDQFIPPADWATASITDKDGVVHNKYWLGWRYTADADSPRPLLLASVQGQPFIGTGVAGILVQVTETLTKIEFFARETSPSESRFVIANSRTGVSASVTLAANLSRQSVSISIPVQVGDSVVIQQLTGHSLVNLADGFILLS